MSNQKSRQPQGKIEMPHNHARKPKLAMVHANDGKTEILPRGGEAEAKKKIPKIYK